jgi:hypothetical protein
MSVNFCSVCRVEKSDSKWRNISENGKEKAELVGNYELKTGEKICSKCYNSYIAYNRNNRYYKRKTDDDAPYRGRKSNEMEINNDTSNFTLQELQNQVIELKAELEKITRPSNQHIKGY